MKNYTILIITIIITSALLFTGCKKDKTNNPTTLNELYTIYKDGKISECRYNGELVYTGELNAHDAGSTIYDQQGNQIGSCNDAWSHKDEICSELQQCETIYLSEDNIWGQPPVDKYKLAE